MNQHRVPGAQEEKASRRKASASADEKKKDAAPQTRKPSKPVNRVESGGAKSENRAGWTFLTNYSHVLICLARDPEMRLRDVATQVDVTERAVQRIVADLEAAGILTRRRDGRRNRYSINESHALRHPLEAHCTIRELLAMVETVE